MKIPIIEVAELTFAYSNSLPVFKQLSFQIGPQERVGLAGPNGAGKSTLLLCLAGVMPVSPGRIRIDGLDPAVPTERRLLPTRLGLVFQHADDQLIHATVADDVAFGPVNLQVPQEEIHERVDIALAQVGLTDYRERSPHRLSGGEKRRAALAGVLAMRPKILLLDEPTSNLDARGKNELIKLLNQLSMTLMIASHDLDLLRRTCHRVIILDSGRLAADGTVAEILSNQSRLADHGMV